MNFLRWFWWFGAPAEGAPGLRPGDVFRRLGTGRKLDAGCTSRRVTADPPRVVSPREVGRRLGYDPSSRVFGGDPVACCNGGETRLTKGAAEVRQFLFDFSRFPELTAGATPDTIASAVVFADAGLTAESETVTTEDIEGVPEGLGVLCLISGGTSGTEYAVSCRATTAGGSVLEVPGVIVVR